jgi:outer membrane protein OmpA-like peptidoglycan-associated protein
MLRFSLPIVLFASMVLSLHAQDEETEQDSVETGILLNGDFERYTGRLSRDGKFYLVDEWETLTTARADLFEEGNAVSSIGIPQNMYGYQKAFSGEHYAGINAFSVDPRNYRSYLYTQLNEFLDKGSLYCVKYHVSLAERSRYAVANLGAYFSSNDEAIDEREDLYFDAQIKNNFQKVLKNQSNWEAVCNVLAASGKEDFLIIGNMDPNSETVSEKIPAPEGLAGPQVQMAYYYIDLVSITKIDRFSECKCSVGKDRGPDMIYSKSYAPDEDASDAEVIKNSTIYFGYLKKNINASGTLDLDRIAQLMKENESYTVKIMGHTDAEEAEDIQGDASKENLARDRAYEALDYLAKKGIDKGRFEVYSMEDKLPVSYRDTPLSKAKNRRVEFELVEE